ncbi:MAG: hypothetical protein R6U40_03230, partial [Desulfobacterales bacterium]
GIPEYTGEIAIDFSGTTRYDEWTAGSTVDIEISWVGAVIDSPETDFFKVRLPAVQWTDGNPEVNSQGAFWERIISTIVHASDIHPRWQVLPLHSVRAP